MVPVATLEAAATAISRAAVAAVPRGVTVPMSRRQGGASLERDAVRAASAAGQTSQGRAAATRAMLTARLMAVRARRRGGRLAGETTNDRVGPGARIPVRVGRAAAPAAVPALLASAMARVLCTWTSPRASRPSS
jgi:hypothetical protein